MVRPDLVESSYCKTLGPLKDTPILHHFLHKKYFFAVAATSKRTSQIIKFTKFFF